MLFTRLDRNRTGCPVPTYLPPHLRFQGIAVLEKHVSNPHIHLLLRCQDWLDQFWAGVFLLEMLDNVDKDRADPRDDAWQNDTWDLVQDGAGWSKDLLWSRTSSILTYLAPAGTAMVQMVRTPKDLDKVCNYMTKTWYQSTHQLAARDVTRSYEPVHDWRQLSEFHETVPPSQYARIYRIEPETRTKILDLDMPFVWKTGGKKLR